MAVATAPEVSSIASELKLREEQVHNLVALLDEGCTIPFITRYRKDQTGGLDEEQIRAAAKLLEQHRLLAQRKETILRSIDGQGKLTPELRAKIEDADSLKRLEDLYLPFKPKKQTLAAAARERGLAVLAEELRSGECKDADARAAEFVNPDKGIKTAADALLGAGHILAESFSEMAELRHKLRVIIQKTGKLVSQRLPEETVAEEPKASEKPVAAVETQTATQPKDNPTADAGSTPAESAPAESTPAESATEESSADANAPPSPASESTSDSPAQAEAGSEAEPSAAATAPEANAEKAESAKADTATAKPAPSAKKQNKKKKHVKKKQDEKLARTFQDFFDFSEKLATIPPHRILAINRGERAKILRARIDADFESMQNLVEETVSEADHPHVEFIRGCGRDAMTRLIIPSLEREFRRELTEEAENHAVGVFARNLRSLLLRQPVAGRRVLAIDPGFRSGCKVVAIDEFGNYLEHTLIYVTGKGNRRISARLKLADFIKKHQLNVVVIGNGTACRETESLVAELIAGPKQDELRGPEDEPRQAPAEASTEQKTDAKPKADAVPNTDPAASTAQAGASQQDASQAAESQPAAEASQQTESSSAQDGGQETVATQSDTPQTGEVATETANAETQPAADNSPAEAGADAAKSDKPDAQAAAEPKSEKPPAPAAKKQTQPPQPAKPRKLSQEEYDLLNDDAVRGVSYSIVNEAGASVYSTSTVGREEFPSLDATVRGAVSIGRRLQDPLSELVKIDPGNIGVGMYQHDVKAKHLRSSLDDVVESCVNYVGVELNTASVPLLRYVSGLNQLTARRIYEFRQEKGPLKSREQLKDVPGIGDAAFVQSAGFLRISDSENPLDASWIHPENYATATELLQKLGFGLDALQSKESRAQLAQKMKEADSTALAEELGVGVLTLQDIMQQMVKPGRDPREDLPPPVFRREILKLEDLQPGMQLSGSVLNVVDFGVFVDIGLKDSGLVHISRLSNGYVASPHDVASVGDIVKVWVVEVDSQRRRVSLTMIEPGTERARPERGRKDRNKNQSQQGDGQRSAQRDGNRGGDRGRGGGRPQGRGRKGGRPQQRHTGKPRVFEKKSNKPPAKLSDKMKKGKEPMRTFGQLEQLLKMDDSSKDEKDESKENKK